MTIGIRSVAAVGGFESSGARERHDDVQDVRKGRAGYVLCSCSGATSAVSVRIQRYVPFRNLQIAFRSIFSLEQLVLEPDFLTGYEPLGYHQNGQNNQDSSQQGRIKYHPEWPRSENVASY